jgi:hypothetical protein
MSTNPAKKLVVLANGASIPLEVAAWNLGLLSNYLSNPDLEWDGVYYLREVCLGRPIEREQAQTLVREQLLLPNGKPDLAMQAVVLSAVRGEGRVLHLDSPFTDPTERAIADFLGARDYLRSYLSEEDIRAVSSHDSLGRVIDLLHESKKWVDRNRDETELPGDTLPGTPQR